MIRIERAKESDYSFYMNLMVEEASEYLKNTLELIKISKEEFNSLFKTIGDVYCIYEDDINVGFYWVEKRIFVLHIHAIVVMKRYQGMGIGSTVLDHILTNHTRGIQTIELGVHKNNQAAIALYSKNEFKTIKTLEEINFLIMNKELDN